jgi:hypothetical protein
VIKATSKAACGYGKPGFAGPVLQLTDHETFAGPHADAANKLLTRDYRPPYVVPKTEDL